MAESEQHISSQHQIAQQNLSNKYTNSLQNKVQKLTQTIQNGTDTIEKQQYQIKNLTQKVQKNKKEASDIRMKWMMAKMERDVLQKQHQKALSQIILLQTKLNEYIQIGDVSLLRLRITHLQTINQIQSTELAHLRSLPTLTEKYPSQLINSQLLIIQKNKTQIKELNLMNLSLKKQLDHLKDNVVPTIYNLRQTISDLSTMISFLSQAQISQDQTIAQYERKLQNYNQIQVYQLKIKQLQQKLQQKQKNFKNDPLQLQIPSLSQQRDAILRQYLSLQSKNKLLEQNAKEIKQKYFKLEKKIKQNQHKTVPKQIYMQMSCKYKKAKICLQNLLKKFKKIGAQSMQNLFDNESKSLNSSINTFQNNIVQINAQINVQVLQAQLKQLKIVNQTLKVKEQHSEQVIKHLQQVIYIYDNEVKQNRQQLQINNTMISELSTKKPIIQKHTNYSNVFQTKCISLLQRETNLLKQVDNWKSLYCTLKQKYQSILKNIPQNQSHVSVFQQQSQPVIIPNLPIENQEREVQTEGLSDLHYKEVKQFIIQLKRINKTLIMVPEQIQKSLKTVNQSKTRIQQVTEKYNLKFIALKNQKSQNQAWKLKIKEQIRKQFQEINQFFLDNKVLNALKKAKYLIQYLQKEEEQQQKIQSIEQRQ